MTPQNPKIYHILHVNKLQSIIDSDGLLSDAEVISRGLGGTVIGMSSIKQRRLKKLTLTTYSDLYVGECVPFYYCPRSIMLYMMYKGNSPDLEYHDGQDDIIHLEFNLMDIVHWADATEVRWVMTDSNAGSYYFNDTNDIKNINRFDWDAINSHYWSDPSVREAKQAEFLCESFVPWNLVGKIGVNTKKTLQQVQAILKNSSYKPIVELKHDWYY